MSLYTSTGHDNEGEMYQYHQVCVFTCFTELVNDVCFSNFNFQLFFLHPWKKNSQIIKLNDRCFCISFNVCGVSKTPTVRLCFCLFVCFVLRA